MEVRQQMGEGHRLLSARTREVGRDLAVGGGLIRSWIRSYEEAAMGDGEEVGVRPSLRLLLSISEDAELRLPRARSLSLSLSGPIRFAIHPLSYGLERQREDEVERQHWDGILVSNHREEKGMCCCT